MKYMLIMRATQEAKEAYEGMDFNEVITRMGQYNEQLVSAGVLLAGEGLSDDIETTGFVLFPAVYMMIAAVIGVVAVKFMAETAGASLRGTELPDAHDDGILAGDPS